MNCTESLPVHIDLPSPHRRLQEEDSADGEAPPKLKRHKKEEMKNYILKHQKSFTSVAGAFACGSPDSKSVLSPSFVGNNLTRYQTKWTKVKRRAEVSCVPMGRTSLSLCSQNRKNSLTSGMLNS